MIDRLKEIDVPRVLRIQQVEDMIEKHCLPIPVMLLNLISGQSYILIGKSRFLLKQIWFLLLAKN